MSPTSPLPGTDPDHSDWPARQREWQRRLPRLRLQAEPVEEQLDRLRRATVAITIVAVAIGLLFLMLFSAFGAPLIGLVVGGVLVGAVVTPAWRSFLRLRSGAAHYLQERDHARS